RDFHVTGVQTCALPIYHFVSSSRNYPSRDRMYINNFYRMSPMAGNLGGLGGYYSPLWTNPYFRPGQTTSEYKFLSAQLMLLDEKIGRASCRERVEILDV